MFTIKAYVLLVQGFIYFIRIRFYILYYCCHFDCVQLLFTYTTTTCIINSHFTLSDKYCQMTTLHYSI